MFVSKPSQCSIGHDSSVSALKSSFWFYAEYKSVLKILVRVSVCARVFVVVGRGRCVCLCMCACASAQVHACSVHVFYWKEWITNRLGSLTDASDLGTTKLQLNCQHVCNCSCLLFFLQLYLTLLFYMFFTSNSGGCDS